ncbi:MAG: hypothetical protein LBC30_01165 [Puniceicoccales bacterium]|jgi:hypothetical protein|nr:hypothetical protein [Puniceicoccales bacterium]
MEKGSTGDGDGGKDSLPFLGPPPSDGYHRSSKSVEKREKMENVGESSVGVCPEFFGEIGKLA